MTIWYASIYGQKVVVARSRRLENGGWVTEMQTEDHNSIKICYRLSKLKAISAKKERKKTEENNCILTCW
ncbi:MAG: hypothetical protein JWN25_435 [Verrucomicrobiales bacterium]|nr:hypothetical protein [Verrucomicrobiales bacterium]